MSSIGGRSCEIIIKEKTPLSREVVCFQMLDFETSNKLEVSKSNSWKISSFSKTTSLQREPFLTMFYTINLSPLLVTVSVAAKAIVIRRIRFVYWTSPLTAASSSWLPTPLAVWPRSLGRPTHSKIICALYWHLQKYCSPTCHRVQKQDIRKTEGLFIQHKYSFLVSSFYFSCLFLNNYFVMKRHLARAVLFDEWYLANTPHPKSRQCHRQATHTLGSDSDSEIWERGSGGPVYGQC